MRNGKGPRHEPGAKVSAERQMGENAGRQREVRDAHEIAAASPLTKHPRASAYGLSPPQPNRIAAVIARLRKIRQRVAFLPLVGRGRG